MWNGPNPSADYQGVTTDVHTLYRDGAGESHAHSRSSRGRPTSRRTPLNADPSGGAGSGGRAEGILDSFEFVQIRVAIILGFGIPEILADGVISYDIETSTPSRTFNL